ncbi:CpsB/CapC family capsule biosynthesis tyrosine phosphatase [Bacillus sp. FJAT-50079]|uniref:tyrosine-protein phosphatase n=1 Tax=Bacillus sp. FJAT-50079 TaxID=2833577 RepID=UPI001BC9039D|nr:CpsB/CapC family capsule biosynthesis tyrosine phosphatase [Bacillus sp. FJAT-50079]MBS4206716.1 tyrosine protein phosphatase [Bacillus sp. FJAT-50079]
MIDIHCHILPDVDDGSSSFTESLQMARLAEKEGIRTIIATPHHQNGRYTNKKDVILQKTAELNDFLQSENVQVEILPGQETRIYGEFIEDYEAGEIVTLGNQSTYIFIELPSNHVPRYTDQLCYDIQVQGLTPVIVHPERNAELIEQPHKLYKLVKNGVATQITAASFTGYFGKKIQKFAFDLIEANLTHFMASDAHNTTKRSFKMEEAFDLLEKKYGTDTLYYFMDNAELILEGKDIDRDVPREIKRKKFLGIF